VLHVFVSVSANSPPNQSSHDPLALDTFGHDVGVFRILSSLDEASGDDIGQLKQETLAEFLRREFGREDAN